MSISIEKKGQASVVVVKDRIDGLSVPVMQDQLEQLIDSGEKNLLFDLSQVNYVSSVGFRLFLILQKKLKPQNGVLVLMNVQSAIKKLFDLSGFTSLFLFSETLEEGISYIPGCTSISQEN